MKWLIYTFVCAIVILIVMALCGCRMLKHELRYETQKVVDRTLDKQIDQRVALALNNVLDEAIRKKIGDILMSFLPWIASGGTGAGFLTILWKYKKNGGGGNGGSNHMQRHQVPGTEAMPPVHDEPRPQGHARV